MVSYGFYCNYYGESTAYCVAQVYNLIEKDQNVLVGGCQDFHDGGRGTGLDGGFPPYLITLVEEASLLMDMNIA